MKKIKDMTAQMARDKNRKIYQKKHRDKRSINIQQQTISAIIYNCCFAAGSQKDTQVEEERCKDLVFPLLFLIKFSACVKHM